VPEATGDGSRAGHAGSSATLRGHDGVAAPHAARAHGLATGMPARHDHGGVPCGGHGMPMHPVHRAHAPTAPAPASSGGHAGGVVTKGGDDDEDVSAVARATGGGGGGGRGGKGRSGKKR